MSTLSRTYSTFVVPAPRAPGAPNGSLKHDHRQDHPTLLYIDENHTQFNTPNGPVPVPQPLQLGSLEWKQAQLTQKKIEAAANDEELTPAQLKRAKKGIEKAAKSYNDKQLAEEKLAEETRQKDIIRKQIRKDKKKAMMKEAKQNKAQKKQAALHQEAIQLVEQCEKLGIKPLISPSATVECAIERCQEAILKYMNTPPTDEEIKKRDEIAAKQKANISADLRASEVFRDVKTHIISADQQVEGEDPFLPKKKKKKNKNKPSSKSQVPASEPEVNIDWGAEVEMGVPLTRKQRSRIAAANLAANSA